MTASFAFVLKIVFDAPAPFSPVKSEFNILSIPTGAQYIKYSIQFLKDSYINLPTPYIYGHSKAHATHFADLDVSLLFVN